MLEKKYGKFNKPSFSMNSVKYVTDNFNKNRDIVIKCDGFVQEYSFYIMYKDSTLNFIVKKRMKPK